MRNSGVYEIRNRLNGKRYIGSAANLKARWRIHLSTLRHRKHGNRHLQAAFVRYGEEAFEFSVLEYIEDSSQRILREQHYFDTLHPEYNIAQIAGTSPMLGRHCSVEHRTRISMARLGHPVSAETRAKISAAWPPERRRKLSVAMSGERNPNYGKHPSAETQAKFRAARVGHSTSDETRAKISAAMTGERNPNYGKRASAETRAKMSAARSGERHHYYGKRLSKEHRRRIGEAQTGKRSHMYGKHLSLEHRKKISLALRAHWRRIHAMGSK